MKQEKINQIYNHLFEFPSLFHQKFGSVFRKQQNTGYKCNKNQNKAIMIIGEKVKITPTLLGKCLDMRKGSLTTLIDSLEEMELVSRIPDENDRRKTWIALTDKGNDYLNVRISEFKKNIVDKFSSLSEEEINEFSDSIKNVINILRNL